MFQSLDLRIFISFFLLNNWSPEQIRAINLLTHNFYLLYLQEFDNFYSFS